MTVTRVKSSINVMKYKMSCLALTLIEPQMLEWINCNGISTLVLFLNGFMVLDIDNCVLSNTNDSYYSLMTTSRNTCDNVIIWHARLGHIGQERMNRLVRENRLG